MRLNPAVLASTLASLLMLAPSQAPATTRWQALYGDELLFEVRRKGEPVGFYRQRFSGDEAHWQVQIEMTLEVPWWWWHYRYRYRATETWSQAQLQRLEVTIDRNGEITRHSFDRTDPTLRTEANALLPTHHYNADVLSRRRVFNTLEWRSNAVTIVASGRERVSVGDASLPATRYRYQGELTGVDAWYDDAGRWLGLRFNDESGAQVELRCIRCRREDAP